MRAGMVGLAGAFLVLPTWILGCVALVASVVGIVALPFWLLLFPIAVGLGAGLGYLAVARNVGEWVASRDINGLDWLRPTNTFYAITAGIGALLTFSVSASILDIVPFFGFFSGLLATLGALAIVATLLVAAGTAYAGPLPLPNLPAPGILGLVAAGVVAAIGVARLRK